MADACAPTVKGMSPLLIVSDLEAAIDHYTSVLGFAEEFRYEDFYAGLHLDGYPVHLKTGAVTEAERENRRANEHVDVIFVVEGVAELARGLTQRGANVVQPLRQMPYGTEIYVADPDGYILSFLEVAPSGS